MITLASSQSLGFEMDTIPELHIETNRQAMRTVRGHRRWVDRLFWPAALTTLLGLLFCLLPFGLIVTSGLMVAQSEPRLALAEPTAFADLMPDARAFVALPAVANPSHLTTGRADRAS